MNSFKKPVEVDIHDVDFNGVCRMSSLMKYIQSAAQTQLTENGMSYESLRERNRALIITKIKLEFNEPVRAYDRLVAETFPCISRGFSFIRCYALYKGEKIIGRAISVWALVDTETRKLVRVNDFELNLPTYEAWDIELSYFRMPDTMKKAGTYTVSYADLDQNMHVNNTKYADIFSNFIPLNNKRINSITVNYVNEAKYKDELTVYTEEIGGTYYVRSVLADGRINSEAEIHLTDL